MMPLRVLIVLMFLIAFIHPVAGIPFNKNGEFDNPCMPDFLLQLFFSQPSPIRRNGQAIELNNLEREHLFKQFRHEALKGHIKVHHIDIRSTAKGPLGSLQFTPAGCDEAVEIFIRPEYTELHSIVTPSRHVLPYLHVQNTLITPLLQILPAKIEAETFIRNHYNGIYRIDRSLGRLLQPISDKIAELGWKPGVWVAMAGRRKIKQGCVPEEVEKEFSYLVPNSAYLIFTRPGYRMEWTFAGDRYGTSLVITLDYTDEQSLIPPGKCKEE